MSAVGTKWTSACALHMSAFDPSGHSVLVAYRAGATPRKPFNSPRPIFASRVLLLRVEIHAFRRRCVGRPPATFQVRFDRGGMSRSLKSRQHRDAAIARLPYSTILKAQGYLSRFSWQPPLVILIAALKQMAAARSCRFEPEFWHLTPRSGIKLTPTRFRITVCGYGGLRRCPDEILYRQTFHHDR